MWDELSKWLGEQKPGALPKSPLGTAIGYASNNWDALKRYLEQGFLALDNNLSERTLRAIALGRNNWGVIGSEVGGQTAAVLYSVVGTCKHLGIDPFAYLRDALPGLFALGEKPTAGATARLAPGSLAVEPDAGPTRPRRDRRVNRHTSTRSTPLDRDQRVRVPSAYPDNMIHRAGTSEPLETVIFTCRFGRRRDF